eukprot:GGOE01015692.1.p1 GENE.GGOE01015692.1~~GGOE01015692.1.p1  ORF type:complete len:140 (+),score=23.27 GGOE01015692.1:191-610(+)
MMRHSEGTYVQPLWSEVLRQLNVTYSGMALLPGPPGDSCVDVCSRHNSSCVDRLLALTSVNSCATISGVLRVSCSACIIDRSSALTPWFNPKSAQCFVNYLHDPALMPACDARDPRAQRMCACLPAGGNGEEAPSPVTS